MMRFEMATLPLTVLLTLILSFTFVSSLSDKHRDKLDEIEQLLRRLQNEIDRIRGTDNNARHSTQGPSVKRNSTDGDVTVTVNNDYKTETSSFETNDVRDLTTWFENPTTQQTKTDSDTSEVFDSTAVNSDPRTTRTLNGLDLTTGPSETTHPDGGHSTVPSRSEVTENPHEATTDETKDRDIRKKKDHEETAEDELREVESVRRLIDEGEDLERQLRGVFRQLRSFNECSPLDEACGLRVMSKCCKGLKCSTAWNGTCYLDCIPYGKSCSENFFCCSGHQCLKSENTYVCQ